MFPLELLEQRIRKKLANLKKNMLHLFLLIKKKKDSNLFYSNNYSKLRLTVDTKNDYLIIKKIIKHFDNDIFVTLKDIVSLYKKNPKFLKKTKM